MRGIRRGERGAYLLLALVVMGALSLMLWVAAAVAMSHRDAARVAERERRALAGAEAALDLARLRTARGGPDAGALELELAGARASARAELAGGRLAITSEAVVADHRGRSGVRIVEIRVARGIGWATVERREERLP